MTKHLPFFARLLSCWCLLCLSATVLMANQQLLPKPLANNERIVCLGDSITHDGRYIFYAQLFTDLRMPGSNITFLNAGVSGDTAGGGIARWAHDVKPMKPNRIFVMFGMNDVGRWNYASNTTDEKVLAARQGSLNHYEKNQRRLTQIIVDEGITPVLVTPSPYDQYGTAPKAQNLVACNDPGLAACADIVRKLAVEKNFGLVEFHRPMTALLQQHPDLHLCGGDRVHPGNEGHLLMAFLLLEATQANGQVAAVAIDGAAAKVVKAENAAVSNLQKLPRGVSFTYAPKALPFPVFGEYRKIDAVYPLTQKLNQEIIRINGLPEGSYSIKVDDRELAKVTAQQLSEGVNIALLDTPSQRLAQQAGKHMRAMCGKASNLRNVAFMNSLIIRRKGNIEDIPECFRILDEWLAEGEAKKYPALGYYKMVVKSYKELRPRQAEVEAEIAQLRKQQAAIRPAPFTIVIQ